MLTKWDQFRWESSISQVKVTNQTRVLRLQLFCFITEYEPNSRSFRPKCRNAVTKVNPARKDISYIQLMSHRRVYSFLPIDLPALSKYWCFPAIGTTGPRRLVLARPTGTVRGCDWLSISRPSARSYGYTSMPCHLILPSEHANVSIDPRSYLIILLIVLRFIQFWVNFELQQ